MCQICPYDADTSHGSANLVSVCKTICVTSMLPSLTLPHEKNTCDAITFGFVSFFSICLLFDQGVIWCCCLIRMQMSCHRLLQRGFAAMYGYPLPQIHGFQMPSQPAHSDADLTEYANAAVHAESAKALHFKMKGARVLTAITGFTR